MITNTEWRKSVLSLIATIVFAVLCLISYTTIDGMSGGYALTFISFFLAVSSIAVSLLFIHRARVDGCDPRHPSPLAHWTSPEETVRASAEREFRNYEEQNRAMFILIGGMLVAAALFFIIFVQEGGLKTGILLLVVTAFLFVISRVVPGLERQRVIRAPHEALITKAGIIYEGSVYPFRSFLVYQNGVSIHKADKKDPARLIFSFTQLVSYFIIRPFDIVIPVPPGEEQKAGWMVRELGGDTPE